MNEMKKLLKSYQIAFLQYVALSNKSSHISLTYCFGLLIICPEVNRITFYQYIVLAF